MILRGGVVAVCLVVAGLAIGENLPWLRERFQRARAWLGRRWDERSEQSQDGVPAGDYPHMPPTRTALVMLRDRWRSRRGRL